MQKDLRRLEQKVMLIGILLFLCAWLFGTGGYLQPFTQAVRKAVVSIVLMAVIQWVVVRKIISIYRKQFPDYSKTLRRIILSITTAGIIGVIIGILIYDGIPLLSGERRLDMSLVTENFGPMFFFSAMVVGAHEVMYNFYELRRIDKEREELKKAHLQSQLDSLKTQVNPHFLFNSLNTLLSLISVSPAKAETFVLELSSVYRYLLQSNEKQLATLEEELKFAHSYFHLLKTRYEDGIELVICVGNQYLDYLIPSLTLQLLLENAVKHNVISSSKPLTISVTTSEFNNKGDVLLTVRNNLQRKSQAVSSNQMGLANILSKFKLLNRDGILITDKDHYFTVTLPLIKHETA